MPARWYKDSGDDDMATAVNEASQAHRVTNQTVTTGTNTQANLDTIDFDYLSAVELVNNHFKIAKSGIYLVTGQCRWTGNATGYRIISIFNRTQSQHGGTNTVLSIGTSSMYTSSVDIMKLDKEDELELNIWLNSGGNLTNIKSYLSAVFLRDQ